MNKEDDSYEEAKVIFTNYLTKNKHRKTSERFAILKKVFFLNTRFDAESLYKEMQVDYRVSLATVYNTLDLLVDCALVTKHQFGNNTAFYEKCLVKKTIHSYLVCGQCGSIKEFSDKQMRTCIQSKKFTRFDVAHYALYVHGICSKCKLSKYSKKKENK